MKDFMKRSAGWLWITLHSAAYLILAGMMLSWFDVPGMLLWFIFGWVLLLPTLFAPQWLNAVYVKNIAKA